ARELKAHVTSDVDPHKLSAVLTEGARNWLDQFTWQKAPDLDAELAVTLPAWTNSQPDWREEVQPTVFLNGQFKVTKGGAFRGIPAATAQSHFVYSNMMWRLPDLVATRPEGRIEALHIGNDRTHEFYWQVVRTV